MRTGSWILRVGVAALALAGPVSAQQQLPAQRPQQLPGGPPPVNRLEMERRLQQAFAKRVREELGLDAAKAAALGNATLGFQRERQDLVRRENVLRRRYRLENTEAGGGRGAPMLPDTQAMEILRELKALRADETDLYNREQEQLLQMLTPAQVVRYYLLREQLADRINGVRGAGPGPAAGAGRATPPAGRGAVPPPGDH